MIIEYGLIVHFHLHHLAAIVLLYAGPDQALPLISILGAIIGFLLMWWRRFTQLLRRVCQMAIKKSPASAKKLAR